MSAVPEWVVSGWYANNPEKQQMAIAHYLALVPATPAELAVNRAYLAAPKAPTFPCSGCGKFAFAERRFCFWCRRG